MSHALKHGVFVLLEKLIRWSVNPRLRGRLLALFGATIGDNARIYEIQLFNLKDGFKNLRIADNVYIGPGCLLDLEVPITIGSRSTLSPGVTILTHADPGSSHGAALATSYPAQIKAVNIGSNCWLGVNVTVLAGVTIGDLAIAAAGSVLIEDVPSSVLVAGVPARLKKKVATERAT